MSIELKAQENGAVRISGIAYSGQAIRQPFTNKDLYVDVNGIEPAQQIPLMVEHENTVHNRIGVASVSVRDNQLVFTGEITSKSELAKQIIADGKKTPWQVSIGASIVSAENVGNDPYSVNGKQVKNCMVVTKAKLREISVVAIGADDKTEMNIAQQFTFQDEREIQITDKQKEAVMAEDIGKAPQTEEAVKLALEAERNRVSAIGEVCAGEYPDIEKQAISAGWSPEETASRVLARKRAERPVEAPASMESTVSGEKTLEASLLMRMGFSGDDIAKQYGEHVAEVSAKDSGISLKELICETLRLSGKPVGRSFGNDEIRAAFSTVSLPGILNNVANKKALRAYNDTRIIAPRVCTEGDLSDFKESERYRLNDIGEMQEVTNGGEIKDTILSEDKATNQLKTYGKKFCLTRQDIINDDLGELLKVPALMGRKAAKLIDKLFFTRLLANPTQGDTKALFHADHGNLITGTTSVLGVDSLNKAIAQFGEQVDAGGDPIAVQPKYLIVPPKLYRKAIELVKSVSFVGGSTKEPAFNAVSEYGIEVIEAPYLSNSNYTGYSETAWYLFADPKETETFEIGYLRGKRTPTVEQGYTDFNTLGMWFRVFFDLGVREQDFRGVFKATGAN